MNQKNQIERDKQIKFHEEGTLAAVTRWLNQHEDGFPEWMKNVRAAYQQDRANVKPEHRVAALLFKDKEGNAPARLGILDVGGATNEDVERWGVWQDPDASRRGSDKFDEITQGNGGKSYMYRLFKGPAYIFGVKDNKLNCKGFVGDIKTLERGIPGYIPDTTKAKDCLISSWEDMLVEQLKDYDFGLSDLPSEIRKALNDRKAFTLVQGIEPLNWEEKPDINFFIKKVLKKSQATLPVQQIKFYAIHNGKLLFDGNPLQLEQIPPYLGFEGPFEYEIPASLKNPENNKGVSTTKNGKYNQGKIVLFTSKDSMESNFVRLKPRWKVTYKTKFETVGQKDISEVAPTVPGSHFIYASAELDALTDFVNTGRLRPTDGDLMMALDDFLAENIRALARKINETRMMEQDENILDDIHKDNKFLNEIKNEFMPEEGQIDLSSILGNEAGGKKKKKGHQIDWGKIVDRINLSTYQIKCATGFKTNIVSIVKAVAKDFNDKPVITTIHWKSNDCKILNVTPEGDLEALSKGKCTAYAYIEGSNISSPLLEVKVVNIKEIYLIPRIIQVPLGQSKQITAKVIDYEGIASIDVLLNWRHDSDNSELVKITPKGFIFGNVIGKTNIYAGVDINDGLWNTIPTEVEVIKGVINESGGSGFPQLLMTGKDKDPITGEIRQGNSEQPALWQEVIDVQNNIWWLNMQSKDANFAYELRKIDLTAWRLFHAKLFVEMMIQVWMSHEYIRKGDNEKPELWSSHKANYERFYVDLTSKMWDKLAPWIKSAGGMTENER
ncbi:hypothetical protein HYU40_05055 [Candidatus Woesearchaeota archaeon]|nr:hypothetical protein [Candidatus Woesearchaeota archaeon]